MARPYRRVAEQPRGSDGTCPVCGKQRYRTRKVARRIARRYPGIKLYPYLPLHGDLGWWHLGTRPAEFARGEISRAEISDDGRVRRWKES